MSQLARMRLLSGNKQKSMAEAVESGPSEEVLRDKLRVGKFVLFYIKGDPCSYVRYAEVTQVDTENRGFTARYNIHRVPSKNRVRRMISSVLSTLLDSLRNFVTSEGTRVGCQ